MERQITLSPLNAHTIKARALSEGTDFRTAKGKVEEVVMYRCPVCRELHDFDFDAEECCREPEREAGSEPNCPVCGATHHNHRDAADCCLWKDMDAIARWKIADAVENGSTWAEELGINQFGMKEAA